VVLLPALPLGANGRVSDLAIHRRTQRFECDLAVLRFQHIKRIPYRAAWITARFDAVGKTLDTQITALEKSLAAPIRATAERASISDAIRKHFAS
jgi:hypothetical protein